MKKFWKRYWLQIITVIGCLLVAVFIYNAVWFYCIIAIPLGLIALKGIF